MHFEQQTVGARRERGSREGRDQVAPPRAVAGVSQDGLALDVAQQGDRAQVEQILGAPGVDYGANEGRVRTQYEYSDGANEGTKARAVLYVAGDVFLLFLSEIIFWPIELEVKRDAERLAEASYDAEGRLIAFRAMKRRSKRQVLDIGESDIELLPNAIVVDENEERTERRRRVGKTGNR